MMEPIGFDGITSFIAGDQGQATRWLAEYFSPQADGGYTGRWFEYFSARSDPWHLDANDVAAATALSVPLDGRALQSLFERAAEFDAHLAEAPGPHATIWDVHEADLGDDAPLSQAYEVLRSVPGMGYVTASKMLACKRPHLVPIRDTVVESVLGADREWWAPWRRVMLDKELRDLVERLTPSEVPPHTSILRRIDVILWRAGKSS